MSSQNNRLPPPSTLHPVSSASTAPTHPMAATQLPPLGPHSIPPPAPPYPYHPQPYPLHAPSPYVPPAQSVLYNFATQLPPIQQGNIPHHQNPVRPIRSPPNRPSPAVPLARILHPEPSAGSPSIRSSKPSDERVQTSARSILNPDLSYPRPPVEPFSFRQENYEYSSTPRRFSIHDSEGPDMVPVGSPPHRTRRSSVTPYNHSESPSTRDTTSPGSLGALRTSHSPALSTTLGNTRYRLSVRQQPIAARACGNGERDRRVIDPPPILQLTLKDFDPNCPTDMAMLRWPLNIVHCALYSVPTSASASDVGRDVTTIPDPNNSGKDIRRLMGTLVASPFIGTDPDATLSQNENARLGCFYIFHDLSCRQNGLYRLQFTLATVGVDSLPSGGKVPTVSRIVSDVFEVFSAKDFPGMRSSTRLTRDLKRQGANVQVKKGNEGKGSRKSRKRTASDSEDSEGDDSDAATPSSKGATKKWK